MDIYEDENIVVKPSPIEGMGSVAKRPIKKGEVGFRWHPKVLTKEEADSLPLLVLKSNQTAIRNYSVWLFEHHASVLIYQASTWVR
ncbi:MAG: hypothetical protein WC030_00740 [Candidatus Paceibacterota bacterium]